MGRQDRSNDGGRDRNGDAAPQTQRSEPPAKSADLYAALLDLLAQAEKTIRVRAEESQNQELRRYEVALADLDGSLTNDRPRRGEAINAIVDAMQARFNGITRYAVHRALIDLSDEGKVYRDNDRSERYGDEVWRISADELKNRRSDDQSDPPPAGVASPNKPPDVSKSAEEKPQTSHSADFTSVVWFGIRYQFKKGHQAKAVELLWKEWERGGHSLTQAAIGDEIGSCDERFELAKVFREKKPRGGYTRHSAWGTMIQSVAKGAYALAAPSAQTSVENPRIRK